VIPPIQKEVARFERMSSSEFIDIIGIAAMLGVTLPSVLVLIIF